MLPTITNARSSKFAHLGVHLRLELSVQRIQAGNVLAQLSHGALNLSSSRLACRQLLVQRRQLGRVRLCSGSSLRAGGSQRGLRLCHVLLQLLADGLLDGQLRGQMEAQVEGAV